jgi:hypothetical protein
VRFGIFVLGGSKPIEVYEGDFSEMTKPPYVTIYKEGPDKSQEAVAHINLAPGYSVRAIADQKPIPFRDVRVPGARQ